MLRYVPIFGNWLNAIGILGTITMVVLQINANRRPIYHFADIVMADELLAALNDAVSEASRLRFDVVTTEHLLLGILNADDRVTRALFNNLDVNVATLRSSVLALMPASKRGAAEGDLPYSSKSGAAMKRAMQLAETLGQKAAGPEHLLSALLGDKSSVAAIALAQQGVTVESLRLAMRKLASTDSPRAALG